MQNIKEISSYGMKSLKRGGLCSRDEFRGTTMAGICGEDLVMAEYALNQEIFRQTCFHAQQAVEKALKAFLTAKVGTHPKSHSLEQMLLAYPQTHQELPHWQSRLRSLDRFYLPTRYVDALPGLLPSGEPTPEDAEEALRDAKEFVREIQARIGSQP